MDITKLSSRGQVVIPYDIREHKDLKVGEKFLIYETEDSIVLKRIKNIEKAKSLDEFEKTFSSLWKTAKKKAVTKEDVAEEIEKYRENA